MDMNDFFDFQSQFFTTTFQANAVGLKADEHNHLITGDYKNISFPVVFNQECGKNLRDILDTGWVSLYLISDRFKTILEENCMTGWKTFPIELYDKKGNEIMGYHGFSIIGRSGPKSYDNCEIIEKKYVPNGPVCKFYKGVSVDGWDGNDFFIPAGTLAIFITKKAADALKKNKITNLQLTNLIDDETDVDDVLNRNPVK